MARFVDDTIGPPMPPGTAPIPIPTPAPRAELVQAQVPGQAPPGYGHNMTLAALMARQKDLAEAQNAQMQTGGGGTIMGGIGSLANIFVDALNERRARKAEEEGQAEFSEAFKSLDPNTGMLTPEAMDVVMRRAPDVGLDLYKTAMALRASQAKTENWTQIPTPKGETGQWYENATTGEQKKVGGGTEGSGAKLSDIAALRQDVLSDAAYKNMEQAVPIYQAMLETAGRDNPASDLNLVYGIAKLMDPGSVVKEGEQITVRNAQGLGDQLLGMIKQVNGGATIGTTARQQLLTEGYGRMQSYVSEYARIKKHYSDIATRHEIDPRDVVDDFGEIKPYVPPDETTPPPPAATEPAATPPAATPPAVVDSNTPPTGLREGQEATDEDGNDWVVRNGKWVPKPRVVQ